MPEWNSGRMEESFMTFSCGRQMESTRLEKAGRIGSFSNKTKSDLYGNLFT
jgi:hypothetical protein